ncbi:hypothetical protein QOZ80_2AG0116370 [Eleusine coracana subsp. coracana]|nr:hypothetical protein QOZ80_2AG0116370 [Eleusine coracana subsp. coracana]
MKPLSTRQHRNALVAAPTAGQVPFIDAAPCLSSLPDDVLRHILGFLPAHEAVRTSVLARCWRHIWKSTNQLRIACGPEEPHASVKEVKDFVHNLLQSRGVSLLESCDLILNEFDDEDVSRVNSWIWHVVKCHVRVLRLYIYRKQRVDREIWLQLDNMPLVSRHLTRLDLYSLQFNDRFLDFSSCVVLEDLDITLCDFLPAKRISSHSLKRLSINSCEYCLDYRIRITAPNLVSLTLQGMCNRTPVLEEMPCLVEAVIKISTRYDCCYYGDAYGNCGACFLCYYIDGDTNNVVLLKGLSEAKYLALIPDPDTFILRRDLKWCPTFRYLKTLLLNEYWCVPDDFSALECILQHCPVLEELTFQLFSKLAENF